MDNYGVLDLGGWLISIPGALLYMAIIAGLVWITRPKVWWFEVSVLIAFNLAWLALGLSFIAKY